MAESSGFLLHAGIALIAVKNKEVLIKPLDAAAETLQQVSGFVMRLTPYGVFAIGAAMAGTISVENLGRLQAYLPIYVVYIGIMTFGVLPMLITVVTPFSCRKVMGSLRAPMLIAFVTGKMLVVFAFLVVTTRELFHETEAVAKAEADRAETDANIEVLYPRVSRSRTWGSSRPYSSSRSRRGSSARR